jgi:hypothetical protein
MPTAVNQSFILFPFEPENAKSCLSNQAGAAF